MWSSAHLIRVWVKIGWISQIKAFLIWIKHINLISDLLSINRVHKNIRHFMIIQGLWTFSQALSVVIRISHSWNWTYNILLYFVVVMANNYFWSSNISKFFLNIQLLRLGWLLNIVLNINSLLFGFNMSNSFYWHMSCFS